MSDISNVQEKKFVIFILGKEEFGMDITNVISIEKLQVLTTIPHTPEFIKGVIHLREEVIPVIDLRMLLNIEPTKDEVNRMIITNVSNTKVALIVDAAQDVVDIPTEVINPSPMIFNQNRKPYLSGIARCNERLILLLNTHSLLTAEELDEVNHVLEEGQSV